jgi:sodium transport system permease protein
MLLRDTRTILIAVVTPLIVFPAFVLLSRFAEKSDERRLEEATYEYAVTGSQAEWGRAQVEGALALDAADPDTLRAPANFVEIRTGEDPDSLLADGELALVVEAWSPEEYLASLDSADATGEVVPVRALQVRYRANSDISRTARDRLRERLGELRDLQRDSAFRAVGFPVELAAVARVSAENVATPEKEAGALLGVALTPFLLLLMLSGGSIVAADAISGEKERGTLETLLTTAVSRRQVVQAKLAAVIVVGLAVTLVNVANLAVYLGLGVFDLPTSLQVSVGPAEILLLLALFVPVTVLVASALLLLSGVSKSYKEYQIYFFPVFLAFFIPSLAAAMPGVELRSVVAVIPLAGVAVAVKEILVGGVDWVFAGVAFLSTGGLAAWMAGQTERSLSNERLISSAGPDEAEVLGGPALFPRRVLRWFGIMWVLLLVSSLWFGEALGVRGGVTFNLVGIFFGGSLLMLWRYRLPVRETLSWRMPHPTAWPAALIGAPSALVLGVSLGEVVNRYVFPIPDEVIRSFGQSIAPPDLALWQLVLFVAVFPGFFEEFAFRGLLLHGLRQRMKPAMAIALSALIFGFFHVSLFRIAPTAFLGLVFGLSVVLTGSIFPAMLWHFLNNAISLVGSSAGWIGEDFTLPGWAPAAAAGALALSIWMLWNWGPVRRRPRPDPG